MRIHDPRTGEHLGDVDLPTQVEFAIGPSGYNVNQSPMLQEIFAKIWRTALERGRAYDPRQERPRDPDGLVGPTDAETIGHPWCPWCRQRAHFGACGGS